MIKVTILGSGDAFGSSGRRNSCILIEGEKANVLFDCGASSLTALNGIGFKANELTHIFNTHHHGDHYGGIPFLLLSDCYKYKRENKLTLVTPPGGKYKIINVTNLLYPELTDKVSELPIDFVETESAYQDASLSVKYFQVPHSEKIDAYGIRMELEGRIISFTGDTEWTDDLIPLADGSDLLIGECNLLEKGVPGHMDIGTWLEKIPLINTNRLVLTHLGEAVIANQDKYDLEFAYDGMTIDL